MAETLRQQVRAAEGLPADWEQLPPLLAIAAMKHRFGPISMPIAPLALP
ncbi:MAG: hypothetical protein HC890_16605 [Chloroflexaceae bacterium]|nr:hypothetical protein [Chloroflexaceae bacterium]